MKEQRFQSLVQRARAGDADALGQLLTELHGELRRVVERTRRYRSDLSLRTTEVYHEAFLKMFHRAVPGFTDQEHLLAMWANATGWVVIEARRRKGRRPQLDQLVEETMSPELTAGDVEPDEIRAAFEALKAVMPKEGLAAELRLLSGLSTQDVSLLMDRSEPTIRRWVRSAVAWIRVWIDTGGAPSPAKEVRG